MSISVFIRRGILVIKRLSNILLGNVSPVFAPPTQQAILLNNNIDYTPILLSGSSVSYSVSGLGGGAIFNSGTSQITGVMTGLGKYIVAITATNSIGNDTIYLPIGVYNSNTIIDNTWLANNGISGGPWYLSGNNKLFTLSTDIIATGTAFAVIGNNVGFNLNGHTITYDAVPPISILNASFETGSITATNWDFTNAPNAIRYSGQYLNNEVYDGNYSIKYGISGNNEYITSSGTVRLQPYTMYCLSAMMFYNNTGIYSWGDPSGLISCYAYIYNTDNIPTGILGLSTAANRGIQLVEGYFSTSGTNLDYTIKIGVNPSGISVPNKYWFVDDIKLQKIGTHGVVLSPYYQFFPTEYPGLTGGQGTALNINICSGSIIQGSGKSNWGHGIDIHGNIGTAGISVSDCTINVNGNNSSCIMHVDPVGMCSIFNNTFISNTQTISTRDHGDGAVLNNVIGYIYNNTITQGPHMGINCTKGGYINKIFRNIIRLTAKYTNAFAISAHYGSQIYNNTILNSGGIYYSRGIISLGNLTPNPNNITKIYNNTIYSRESAYNQEYGGQALGGAYCIQLENAKNVECYNNNTYAYGDDTPAIALRLNSAGGYTTGIYCYNNTLQAISGNNYASCFKFSNISRGDAGSGVRIENNSLITNDGIIRGSDLTPDLQISNSNISITNTGILFSVISGYGYNHTNFSFIDSVYNDISTENIFKNSFIMADHKLIDKNTEGTYSVLWSDTINTKNNSSNIANTSIVIRNSGGTQIYSGLTDSYGNISSGFIQYMNSGWNIISGGPFSINAVNGVLSGTGTFVADAIKTININIL